jgi:uncharacterized protein (DUF849 family)
MQKLIITVALTGKVSNKAMNPNVPVSLDEICFRDAGIADKVAIQLVKGRAYFRPEKFNNKN